MPSNYPVDSTIPAKKILPFNRNAGVDIIKIIASFGVVTIHVHSSTLSANNFGRFFLNFCVPFFYITSLCYFVASQNKNVDAGVTISKIYRRICIPFFTWSCIYTGMMIFKCLLTREDRVFNIWQIFLYGQSAEHLYYLPELIAMQFLILGLLLLIVRNRQNIGIFLLIITFIYLAWGRWYNYYGVTSSKAILTYLIMSIYIGLKLKSFQNYIWYLYLGILLISLVILGTFINYPAIMKEYVYSLPIGGIGLLFVALSIPITSVPKWIEILSSTTYGIYLSHVLFLEAFEFAAERFSYNIYYNLNTKVLITFLIFTISIGFTLFLRRYTILRSLLLGEE